MSDRFKLTPSGSVLVEIPGDVIRRAVGAGDVVPRPQLDTLTTLEAVELRYVRHVLECCAGNKSRAAKVLGIDRRSLYRYIAKMGAADLEAA